MVATYVFWYLGTLISVFNPLPKKTSLLQHAICQWHFRLVDRALVVGAHVAYGGLSGRLR